MVEKLLHHVQCHKQEGINRNKNINAYLFTILNLTIKFPEQRESFLQRHRTKSNVKNKKLYQGECFIGAQSHFCPVNSKPGVVKSSVQALKWQLLLFAVQLKQMHMLLFSLEIRLSGSDCANIMYAQRSQRQLYSQKFHAESSMEKAELCLTTQTASLHIITHQRSHRENTFRNLPIWKIHAHKTACQKGKPESPLQLRQF